jgi:hypothetical protein
MGTGETYKMVRFASLVTQPSLTMSRLPLNRPLPHPRPHILRPPQPPRHLRTNTKNPRLFNNPQIPTHSRRTSRHPPASRNNELHVARPPARTETAIGNAVLQRLRVI